MANILNGPKQLEAVKEQNQIQEDLLRYRMNYVLKNPDIFLGKLYNSMIEITIPEELKGLPQKRYDYYLDHFWDNVDLEDERLLRSPVLASKTNNYFDKVSVQHSEAINASIDKLLSRKIHPEIQKYFLIKLSLKYEHPNVMGLDACFVHLSDNYLKTYKGIMDGNGSPNTNVEKIKEYYRMILLDQGFAESQLYKIRGLL